MTDMMTELGQQARAAATVLAMADSATKDCALLAAADALWSSRADILAANADDMADDDNPLNVR